MKAASKKFFQSSIYAKNYVFQIYFPEFFLPNPPPNIGHRAATMLPSHAGHHVAVWLAFYKNNFRVEDNRFLEIALNSFKIQPKPEKKATHLRN